MRVFVVTHPVPKDIKSVIKIEEDDVIIGVDQAVQSLYRQRIRIDLAIGDFDSLKNQGMLNTLSVIRLEPVKDVTDTYQALLEAYKMNPKHVFLIGGIGGDRIEHFLIHTMFFKPFPNLVMKDEKSTLFLLKEGTHTFAKDNDFYTFIAYPFANISVKGFKYELNHYMLKTYDPLCISNEIKDLKGTLDVHEGSVLVVRSVQD